MQRVPIDDNGGEQIEARQTVMLALTRSVADFALPAYAQGVLKRMMGLALVETDPGASLYVGIQDPFDDEERALDAADLAQGESEIVLPRIGGEFT